MRQIGRLLQEREAQRFAAFLVTLGIDSHTEQESDDWAIWVRDENRLEEARKEFDNFRYDPNNSRYQGAEREAESIRRKAVQQRLDAQKNVVEMRGRWKSTHASQRVPLTATLIALSVLVTLFGGFGEAEEGFGGTINQELSFVSDADFDESKDKDIEESKDKDVEESKDKDVKKPKGNPLASVGKGELWRTITPIFIHLEVLHLAFNMIMFYQFGRLLESLRGTARFAIAVLSIAIISNLAQAVFPESLGGNPFFGGMSGVVYGLFGYAWMKSIFDPTPGFMLSQVTVIVLIGWLLLCMTPAIGNVANVAHVVGLAVGAAFGFLPALFRR